MSRINDAQRQAGVDIAAWVKSAGSKRTPEVAKWLGQSMHFASRALRAALLDGRLQKFRDGHNAWLWVTPEAVPALAEERRKRISAYGLALYHKRRADGLIDGYGLIVDPPDWDVVQRHAPAAAPLPFRCTAPNSVFSWRPAPGANEAPGWLK